MPDTDKHVKPRSDGASVPALLKEFRVHFVAAPVVALCTSGNPVEVLMVSLMWSPAILLAVEFGLWAHPLNILASLFVFIAIPVMQVARLRQPDRCHRICMAQIGIWWLYWLTLGVALCFGEYRGP